MKNSRVNRLKHEVMHVQKQIPHLMRLKIFYGDGISNIITYANLGDGSLIGLRVVAGQIFLFFINCDRHLLQYCH